MNKKLVIGLCMMIAVVLAGLAISNYSNQKILGKVLNEGIELSIDKNKAGLYRALMEGISGIREREWRLITLVKKKVVRINNKYDIELATQSGPVKHIHMRGVSEKDQVDNLKLAEVNKKLGFEQVYSIDPTGVNFTEATVTAVAKGTELYKCKDWNFSTQTCRGEWIKLKDITPGEEYTFTLTPEDPGLAESNGTFFDGFESGSLSTNNWTTSGTGSPWFTSTGDPYAGAYIIEADNTGSESVVETTIDTTGYINISLSFYYDTDGLDAGEYIAADWYNSTGWTNVLNVEDTAGWTLYNITLPTSAENNSDFRIRFRCSSGAPNEECKVDNVRVSGNKIPDATPPAVTLNKPPANYYNDSFYYVNVTFNCSATDNEELANISLYITNSTNQSFTLNQTTAITGASNSTTWTLELSKGSYTWNCLAYDAAANYDWGDSNRTVNINFSDSTPPQVSSLIPAASTLFNVLDTIEIAADVADISGIDTVLANVTYPNSTSQQLALSNSGGDKYNTSFAIPNLVGQYNITFIANDTYNNINNTKTTFFIANISDITPPTSNSPSDQTVDIGQETTITWILQDNVAPGYYYVERNSSLFAGPYAWSNNTPIINMPNNYFLGAWNYTIYYNDSVGNSGIPDTVLVTVIDNSTPSCEDLTSGAPYPTLVNITVDGNMTDWDAVLTNPKNYVSDLSEGGGDEDIIISADRDMVGFAYTWNDQYLYFHYKRLASGNNIASAIAYLDYGNDGYMNATDKVVKFVWTGSNQKYDSDLYNYIPSGTADLMNGSGYDLPGSIAINKSLEIGVTGGAESGIELEVRVLWSDLGLSGPAPINFQAAIAQGAGTNLPSHIEDNGDSISSLYARLLFRPDRIKAAVNGTSVYYDHDLMNCGIAEDTIDLTNISSQGWNITLYYPNGTAIADTNGNSKPDVTLDVENYTTIIAKIDVPGTTSTGTTDTATVTAASSVDGSYSKTVTDTTVVGQIAIIPERRDVCGTSGGMVTLNYTIFNYQQYNDTIEINASSSMGWNLTLHYINGTLLNDSDGDNHTDIGSLLFPESRDILLKIYIPQSAAIGANDTITIRINSSANPSLTATAVANITVKERLTIVPDYNRTVGIGDCTYYYLIISNNWNESDVIDISYTSALNWSTAFYHPDMITPLSDTDNDSIIDTGAIEPCGSQYSIYAKITVSVDADENDTEITTAYANSSLNTSIYDTAVLNTTARTIITYSDPAHTNEQTLFERGDTVYALAHNLAGIQKAHFEWIDPNSTLIRASPDITVTSDYQADDLIPTNSSSLLGNWTVIVFNAQNDVEIGRAIFLLQDTKAPQFITIKPGAGSQYNQTGNVTLAVCVSENSTVTANISWDATYQFVNLAYNGTEWCYYYLFSNTTYLGNYNVTFTATDDQNRSNTTTTYFTVNDATLPTVALNYPLQNYYVSGISLNVTFNCSATDNEELANISLYITNSTNQSFTLNQTTAITGASNSTTWTLELSKGSYTWNCLAYDAAANYDWGDSNRTVKIVENLTYRVYGIIYDPNLSAVPSTVNLYNATTKQLIATDDEIYELNLTELVDYDIQVLPANGSLKELYFFNYSVTQDVVNFTGVDDTDEDIPKPEIITEWLEVVAWQPSSLGSFDLVRVNISYGNGTGLEAWKCAEWNFTQRKCAGNWEYADKADDGPSNISLEFTQEDPGLGIGRPSRLPEFKPIDVSLTANVAEPGEKVLITATVQFTGTNLPADSDLLELRLLIYWIDEGIETLITNTTNITKLMPGVYYYEFDTSNVEQGNFVAIFRVITNETTSKTWHDSATFTVGGRGIFSLTGITPNMVIVNTTLRLAAEIRLNGELVDKNLFAEPELVIVKINNTSQYFNETNGLSKEDGLIYIDLELNETGVYYLNWSVKYYNRTKQVQEIIVVNDFELLLENVSVGGNLLGIINENKQKLLELLSEMEKHQDFSAEEIFLVTDAVNSMSRVADLLAGGEITEEKAEAEMEKINQRLESSGGRLTGSLTGMLGLRRQKSWFSMWPLLLILIIPVLAIIITRRRAKQNRYAYSGRARRRYEIILSNIALLLRSLRNKHRQRRSERSAASERQQTLSESISKGIERMKTRMKYGSFVPKRKRRYGLLLAAIRRKIGESRRKKAMNGYELEQKRLKKELAFRKAKPEELFRPMQPKKKPRIVVMLAALKQKLHEAVTKEKSARHLHKGRIKEAGCPYTKIKASDLFDAIDEYKYNESFYQGMLREEPVDKLAKEYEGGIRAAVFEESRAIVGLRNAITTIKDLLPEYEVKRLVGKLPRIRLRMPKIRLGENIKQKLKETSDKIEVLKDKKQKEYAGYAKPKTKIEKSKERKNLGRRRYQILLEKIRKKFSDKKENNVLGLLKDAVEKNSISERIAALESEEEKLENDKIKYLAWNLTGREGKANRTIRKAYPSDKDEEAYQSKDSGLSYPRQTKERMLGRLKEIYDR